MLIETFLKRGYGLVKNWANCVGAGIDLSYRHIVILLIFTFQFNTQINVMVVRYNSLPILAIWTWICTLNSSIMNSKWVRLIFKVMFFIVLYGSLLFCNRERHIRPMGPERVSSFNASRPGPSGRYYQTHCTVKWWLNACMRTVEKTSLW